nr:MAG TPA: endonuclease [Caudoviricetes sp.]
MRQLSLEEKSEIIKLYQEGIAANTLKRKFKLQFQDIKTILTEYGITPRTHRESRKSYKYNENYFEHIDTPEKAYWLGFIYADGFITKKTNGNAVFGFTLAEEEPLIKLNQCLESNKPIGKYKKVNSYKSNSIEYKTAFCSNKMVSDLEKHGCVEGKTFKLKFPNLDKNLIPHFIRGYFDGDGSVFLHTQKANNTKYTTLGVTICGIKSFLDDLSKYIGFENCVYKDKRKETDCYSIKLASNIRCLKFYHYLYNNANNMYLSRKKGKFDSFIKDRGSTTTISNPIYGNAEYKKLCYIED